MTVKQNNQKLWRLAELEIVKNKNKRKTKNKTKKPQTNKKQNKYKNKLKRLRIICKGLWLDLTPGAAEYTNCISEEG